MNIAKLLTIAVIVAACFCIFYACGEEDDLGAQNRELADRLTEALEFDSGEISENELPVWQSGDAAPQISEYEVPEALEFDKDFTIRLQSTYLKHDEVETVVVYVADATHYISVSQILEPGDAEGLYVMELKGRLRRDEALDGKEFSVHVALQTSFDVTGEYITWNFSIGAEESALDAETVALIGEACNNLEAYCPDGNYIWNQYGINDASSCNSTYSCAYEYYLEDSDCLNNLELGIRCLGALKDADGCAHCDNLFDNMPGKCTFPESCFE